MNGLLGLDRFTRGLLLFIIVFTASSVAQAATLLVNGADHDYLTLNFYIDEPEDSETLFIELDPEVGNVAEAQIWSNLGRRDYATLDDQDPVSVPGPAPAGTEYFVGFPLTQDGGTWVAEFPIDKTGAYRLTGRYRVEGSSEWTWVGGRDTAVMVSPKKARDVILYELQVNAINATGDTEGTRSTFEDLMDPAKPANLDYFNDLGINTLWIQPIHPIGQHPCVDTSQGPGSPYSIQNMWEVAPHMSQGNTREASMAAFTNFAAEAGARNIDFFFDIIFNHTSWDAEIGRDPDDPTQPAANPQAQIKDILPQWYSKFVGSELPCGEFDYNQDDFQFWLPAENANQIGPAPAERADFGKWPDVADLFWGTYPALFEPQTEDDSFWDVSQTGADVKRMTEYFAYFGIYWIEKSGGTLGGFRCDYAQGIPPQAWEYIVNRTRQVKWDFIFMAESLDGGPVSQRAGRHMDIINQNWVWQVLGNGDTTTGLRGIIDQNKTDYGFAGIMRGLINHDQNAPEDRWYSFSRYAAGAVIDGAPQMYQGQELGYEDNWGFSRFRNQFGRWIPDIFKWHNMQTLWNNRDATLEDAYSRLNNARLANIATRLHDQWYLDRTGGQGPHQQIFSVLKYDRFGWDPAHQNVVLSFVNLTPWTAQSGTFDLASVQAIYINPDRSYNVRNLLADDPNAFLWGVDGISGQDLIDNGLFVSFSADGVSDPDTAFVQMLVLEENGGNEPFDPWVDSTPENPTDCEPVTIRYRKADSPLGGAQVYIQVGRNDWQDVISQAMTDDGDYWTYVYNAPDGTTEINFVFHDGNADEEARVWDNNSGQDWSVAMQNCEEGPNEAVWTDPVAPDGCDPVTVYYDSTGRILASADPVYIHIGYNGWNGVIDPNPAMTNEGAGVWSYTYAVEPGTTELNIAFNNGDAIWDSNGGNDWNVTVQNCEGTPPPPSGFVITNPPSSIAVNHEMDTYTLQGIAENMEGTLDWTNALTGASGSMPHADPWAITNIALAVGANDITVSGMTQGGDGGIETNANDSAANYGTSWLDGSNEGTGFAPWSINPTGTAGQFVNASGWGLWSESGGNGIDVLRPLTTSLAEGDTFHVFLQNGWIWEDGGSIGVALRNDSGDTLWELFFNGGDTNYTVTGETTDIGWTDVGLQIAFHMTGADSYEVSVTPTGGTTRQYTGTVTGTISEFRGWSWNNGTNDGDNSERDVFLNNLMVTTEGLGESAPVDASVTITRLEQDDQDSNGDGVPDSWYHQHGLDPDTPDLGDQPAPNGYTYRESYMMDLDPDDDTLPPLLMNMSENGKFSFGAPGDTRRYMVQHTPDLHQPFVDVGEALTIGEEIELNGDPRGFYRIRFLDMNGGGTPTNESVTVSATPGSTTFTNAGGLSVTLNVSGDNVVTSTYTLDGAAAEPYTDGDIITVGNGLNPGETAALELFGETGAGATDTAAFLYTRVSGSGLSITNVSGTSVFVSETNEVWINSAAHPEGASVSASIIYCVNPPCDGDWPLAAMNPNPAFENGDWWNISLGEHPDGTVISFAVMMVDEQGVEHWDNNGGSNYTVTIGDGGGGGVGGSGFEPYSTNPTTGQRDTMTIDGDPAGWTNDHLIALDMANDDPRSLGSNWTMHEGPVDLTHLWAAWDDDYLYVAWQYVDVTDILDGANAGSAGGGKISNNDGILQWLVLNTGTGGSTADMWDKQNTWTGADTPNYQLYLAGSLWQGFISRSVGGTFVVDDTIQDIPGEDYNTLTAAGIDVAKGDTFGAGSLWGVGDADDRFNGDAPNRNFLTEGHDTSRDSFYEMRIPLTYLGITATDIDNNGIGIMVGGGSDSSMDSIPHDETTLDSEGTTDSNSSWEWEDADDFTAAFAQIGGS